MSKGSLTAHGLTYEIFGESVKFLLSYVNADLSGLFLFHFLMFIISTCLLHHLFRASFMRVRLCRRLTVLAGTRICENAMMSDSNYLEDMLLLEVVVA